MWWRALLLIGFAPVVFLVGRYGGWTHYSTKGAIVFLVVVYLVGLVGVLAARATRREERDPN